MGNDKLLTAVLQANQDNTMGGKYQKAFEDGVRCAVNRLEQALEAQPMWIPVNERLPEDGRPVLIYAWNVHHVIARYDTFRTDDGYKKTWVTADAWNGNTEIGNEVIAWMPLPEPYKGESEEVCR